MDLYFFSFTGTCKEIAFDIGRELRLFPKEIVSYELSYWAWLALSFIPGISIEIDYPEPESKEAIFIFPKWTFNCPPATSFLKKVKFERLMLIISYGGWGEGVYGSKYKEMARKNSDNVGLLLVRRSFWKNHKESELLKIKRELAAFFRSNYF